MRKQEKIDLKFAKCVCVCYIRYKSTYIIINMTNIPQTVPSDLALWGLKISTKTPGFLSFIEGLNNLYLGTPVGSQADYYWDNEQSAFQEVARKLDLAYNNQNISDFDEIIDSMKQNWTLYVTPPKDWKNEKVDTYIQLLSSIQAMRLELTSIQQQTTRLVDTIKEEAKAVIA